MVNIGIGQMANASSMNLLTHMAHTGYMTHMRKQFQQRARLAIYLETSDLVRLTAKARTEGKALVEWARETLLGELENNSEVRPEREVPSARRGASALKRSSEPAEASTGEIKLCRHKLPNCTVCG